MSRSMKFVLALALLALLFCLGSLAVAEDQHVWEYDSYIPATCNTPPYEVQRCTICGKTQRIARGVPDTNAHIWGAWIVDIEADCETNGTRHRVCQNCGARENGSISATGHAYGAYTVTKQPTCTETGTETAICANNAHHVSTRTLPALGHNYKSEVTTPAGCLTTGIRTYTCQNDPSHTYTEVIPATGHTWDAGKDSPAATCTTPGKKIYTCTVCSQTREENIPALGHKWDTGTVTKQPTCTETGTRHQVCQNDNSHTQDTVIPATGHQHTHWVVIKEPTYTEEGERQEWCDDCKTLIRTQKMSVKMYYHNTVCVIGPRLRDVNLSPYNSDEWYMFTPIDVSKDGRQTFQMIASNKYDVGTATVDVRDGMVTFNYKVYNNVDITLEFFTILNQMSDLHEYEPEALSYLGMVPGKAYSIADDFGGDTNLVLYFCSRADYSVNRNVTVADLGTPYRSLCRTMLNLMDK